MRPTRRSIGLVLLAVVSLSACGSRIPRDEALRLVQENGSGVSGFPSATGEQATSDQLTEGTVSGPDAGMSGDVDATATPAGPEGEPQRAVVNDGSTSAGADVAGSSGTKSPIRLGMDGNWTGIIGQSFAPGRASFTAWVALVNERGGVNGHPIELVVSENGYDPARAVTNAKQLIEDQKVHALVNLMLPAGADQPIADFAAGKGVPIIGGTTNADIWHQHPMMFSPVTAERWRIYSYGAILGAQRVKKAATIYCGETGACRSTSDGFKSGAKDAGIEIVYEGQFSLAQPDFTGHCLQAEQGGAEAVLVAGDFASANRMSESCMRQGYEPAIVIPAPSNNIRREMRGLSGMTSFPWFLTSGTPALDEYGTALKKAGVAEATMNGYSSLSWVTAKLVEKAVGNVPDGGGSKEILEGLWAIQNDTLGGLTPPLSFHRGKPASDNPCWYPVQAQGGKWEAPAGLTPTCKT